MFKNDGDLESRQLKEPDRRVPGGPVRRVPGGRAGRRGGPVAGRFIDGGEFARVGSRCATRDRESDERV